jgi:hypothetical protein
MELCDKLLISGDLHVPCAQVCLQSIENMGVTSLQKPAQNKKAPRVPALGEIFLT